MSVSTMSRSLVESTLPWPVTVVLPSPPLCPAVASASRRVAAGSAEERGKGGGHKDRGHI